MSKTENNNSVAVEAIPTHCHHCDGPFLNEDPLWLDRQPVTLQVSTGHPGNPGAVTVHIGEGSRDARFSVPFHGECFGPYLQDAIHPAAKEAKRLRAAEERNCKLGELSQAIGGDR